jgi:hypothetical protein
MIVWRVRTTFLAKPGHVHELITTYKELNELAGKRGWKQSTVWMAATNQEQQVDVDTDYEDLGRWEKEIHASLNDKGWQDLASQIESHRQQGSMATHLFRVTEAQGDVQRELAEARSERDQLKGQLTAIQGQLQKREQELTSKQVELVESAENLKRKEAELEACLEKKK